MNNYIDTLTNHLKPFKSMEIDLILGGGAFNGSYIQGTLYYLKSLCDKKRISINRISGCSIGSLLAYLFIIDKIHLCNKVYRIAYSCFVKHGNIQHFYKIINFLKKHEPTNVLELVNKKLYISYHNVKTQKYFVKSTYSNKDEMYETILMSSHISFIINGNIFYKNVYFDGILPYVFVKKRNKMRLHIDILTFDKIHNAINIVNEHSNSHRLLCGVLDIHMFFAKKSSTNMCSFVEDWNMTDYLSNYFKHVIRYCVFQVLIITYYIHSMLKDKMIKNIKSTLFHKLCILILKEIIKHYNT